MSRRTDPCFLVIFLFTIEITFGQSSVTLRNQIKPQINVLFLTTEKNTSFEYTLANGKDAEQSIWKFWIICPLVKVSELKKPQGWRAASKTADSVLTVSWGSPRNSDIKPGAKLSGFGLSAQGILGIVTFYIEGYAPPPNIDLVSEEDLRRYRNLTAYGPGIVGKTIGPAPSFESAIPIAFLDSLLSYTHQSLDLGWIKNKGIANSLNQKVENARRLIEKRDHKAAKNILEAFLNEVEAQKNRHLSSEAYALLRFNAEYLISKLE